MNRYIYGTKLILLILSIQLFCPTETEAQIPLPFRILPAPREVVLLEGDGLHFGDLGTVSLSQNVQRPVMGSILNQLPEESEDKKRKGTLALKISTGQDIPDSREGYILTVKNGSAEITSRDRAGLFYGCQTLEQLLEDARDYGVAIPACQITDYPEMVYRSLQFDVKHHLDHMNYYYESIDRLARYKINAVVFEFEDKLRYRRQPSIAAPQAISIDEMAALTKYARERNIEITPLVQGLGHATFILKHEEYAHLRELPENRWAFCPLHEGTYQVLFDMYRDAMDATPGAKYFHIGGDEVGNIGLCPLCNPIAEKEGLLKLNLYWLNRVCDFLIENGRTPVFWDDMPLKEAGVYRSAHDEEMTAAEAGKIWKKGAEELEKVISGFPENCVYMRWNYSMGTQPGNIKALEWYQKSGLKSMIATAAQSGHAALFPFDDRDEEISSRGIPAIKSFIELAKEKGIDGMLCTAWDDRSPHMETHWRGFIASAQYSWSKREMSLDEFDTAYLQRDYGVSIPDYVELYVWLRNAADFWEGAFNPTSDRLKMDNAMLPLPGISHSLIPEEGKKIRENTNIDYSRRLIELPHRQNPGKWSEKYRERLDRAKIIVEEYPEAAKKLEELYLRSQENRYHWKVFSALNNFQISAPKLLLALEACDTGNEKKYNEGLGKVEITLDDFNRSWEKLKQVYAQTRFVTYPENYVPDRYYHFASQREDLSYLV
ncbi:family 20 glycosylhydrolase, partial [Mariniphaga sediminis]|uniref:family 20 glycosylhydrolase n=1 Tax=Mariniphaga sediminis TaxID=1628158 RepID=UPI00356320C1